MEQKLLIIRSHYNELTEDQDVILENKDIYDSSVEVWLGDEKLKLKELLYKNSYLNVDGTNNVNYKVEIEDDIYSFIIGYHKNQYLAPLIFSLKGFSDVTNFSQLYGKHEKYRVLKSKYPNPNWNNKNKVVAVNFHKGGMSWDWSLGCLTLLNKYWDEFIKYFKENEKGIIFKLAKDVDLVSYFDKARRGLNITI